MTKKRNRRKQVLSLQDRLAAYAAEARDIANGLPPGPEKRQMLQRVRDSEAAARIDIWLASTLTQKPATS